MISALIPVKGFRNAKQRLAPLLSRAEREILAEAMFRDALDQILKAGGLESIHVVTPDDSVAAIASSHGAKVLREAAERGETAAVDFARSRMKQQGIESVLILPADIPLLRARDLEDLLRERRPAPSALLVPSHDRMGTNALLLSPPDIIGLRFGYDSFSYHLSQVVARQLPAHVIENERIALDIDEPKDLLRFFGKATDGSAYNELCKMGVLERARSENSKDHEAP
jgi:2-phospho-L-lactate guanylyltransferase